MGRGPFFKGRGAFLGADEDWDWGAPQDFVGRAAQNGFDDRLGAITAYDDEVAGVGNGRVHN